MCLPAFFRSLTKSLAAGGLILSTVSANAAGLLSPVSANLPDLAIKEHHVEVTIQDGYAITEVEQVFANPNNLALDAIYSFPVPEKAAVGEFTYWINNQPVTGEVIAKQQARQIYEEEKTAGHKTALVEQDSYKTFDISVAAVQPQTDVRVRLVYVQPTHVDSGIGRYVYPLEDGGVDEAKLAFWNRNEKVQEQFSFNVNLRNSYPIDGIRLPHQPAAVVTQTDAQNWTVSLGNRTQSINGDDDVSAPASQPVAQGPVASLDKDILLYWRHSDGLPGSLDMSSYKQDSTSPGTFMITLTPGDDLAPLQNGRDWIFVLDVSGSMAGKYSALTEGIRQGLAKLSPLDRFRIVLFNDVAHNFSGDFQPAIPEKITPILNNLDQYQPNRGTNLYAGMKMGLRKIDADRPTAMILVTDGVANVGVTEKKAFLEMLEKADLRLYTFVMGNSANRPLLNEMTRVSQGFSLSVSNADDIMGQIMLAADKMSHQAMRNIQLKFDGGRITDLTPEQIGSLYRGQQLTLLGHYRKAGPVKVTLTGEIGTETRTYETEITLPDQSTLNPELERLWAYAKIENLQAKMDYLGEDSDTKQAITSIAIEHGLVTDYTSMIVVEEARFNQLGINRSNKKRVETEHQARQQRAAAPIQQRRADTQKPMFDKKRSTVSGSSGGGAVDPWLLALLIAMAGAAFIRRKQRNQEIQHETQET